MDIIENFDSNEENQIPMEVEEQVLRVPYDAASESCNTLEASVPIGFASEQAYFNNKLSGTIASDINILNENIIVIKENTLSIISTLVLILSSLVCMYIIHLHT
jgi:hypothetical protein